MKNVFKKILQYYLKYLAKIILIIHRPIVIAVAGSINKAFTKEAIKNQLEQTGASVRSAQKSFNTEIGLPLAILNIHSGYNSYKNWMLVILKAPLKIFQNNFPRFLVLELGVSDKGDMKHLLSIIKPEISIITDITQRYLEGFGNIEELLKEYKMLIKKTKRNGLVLLNHDNESIEAFGGIAKTRVEYFGIQKESSWQATRVEKSENGQVVDVKHGDKKTQYGIDKFGQHQVYALLISLAVKNYVSTKKK